jgi:hypothetical protein
MSNFVLVPIILVLIILLGLLLATLSNWLYDLLKQRGVFPDKPNRKRFVITVAAFLPLILLLAFLQTKLPQGEAELPQKATSASQASSSPFELGNVEGDVNVEVHNQQVSNEQLQLVSYQPIPYLNELTERFKLPTAQDNISLRFISPNWKIDFSFLVSKNVQVKTVENTLLEHFSLREHAKFDLSRYPPPSGCGHYDFWRLTANGHLIGGDSFNYGSQSLSQSGVKDGDLLRFKVLWGLKCNVSIRSDQDPQSHESPPDIDP